MKPKWQLYDTNGLPLVGQGAMSDEIFSKGLLHGAAHVWIWRRSGSAKEVLVQKRAANKRTYPGMLDISAAGHIDLGETPDQAAVRETIEEIGLEVAPSDLRHVMTFRGRQTTGDGYTENEYKWVYLLELTSDADWQLQADEVSSVVWKPLDELAKDLANEPDAGKYVYQGDGYFKRLLEALYAA